MHPAENTAAFSNLVFVGHVSAETVVLCFAVRHFRRSGGYDRLRPATTGYDRLRPATAGYDRLRPAAAGCGRLRPTAAGCGWLRPTTATTGYYRLRPATTDYDRLRPATAALGGRARRTDAAWDVIYCSAWDPMAFQSYPHNMTELLLQIPSPNTARGWWTCS